MNGCDKFICKWQKVRMNGKFSYVFIHGTLKYSVVANIIIFLFKGLIGFNISSNEYRLYGYTCICFLAIPVLFYVIGNSKWKKNNDKYTKIMLSKIIGNREEIILSN